MALPQSYLITCSLSPPPPAEDIFETMQQTMRDILKEHCFYLLPQYSGQWQYCGFKHYLLKEPIAPNVI